MKEEPDFFTELSKPQHPKFLAITCADSRISLNEITECHPGEIFCHRNIGNVVNAIDFNVQCVLQYAIEFLKVSHVIVIGHTDCGAIKATYEGTYHGLIDHWLNSIKDVEKAHREELEKVKKEKGEKALYRRFSELNVRHQILNICQLPIVQGAWNAG